VNEYERWLLDGDVEVALALLRRIAAQAARTGPFPPPQDYTRWNDEAVDELLVEMIAKKGGVSFLLDALAGVDNRGSAEQYLLAAVQNFQKDQAKATADGKLRERLKTVLGQGLPLRSRHPPRPGLVTLRRPRPVAAGSPHRPAPHRPARPRGVHPFLEHRRADASPGPRGADHGGSGGRRRAVRRSCLDRSGAARAAQSPDPGEDAGSRPLQYGNTWGGDVTLHRLGLPARPCSAAARTPGILRGMTTANHRWLIGPAR
jgi:hypothetical protein